MHSAAGIEDRLFTPARIRLTAWYVSVLAAVLIVLGTALYLVVREQLLNGVDNGVRLVAAKATEQWVATGNVDVAAQHRPLHRQLHDAEPARACTNDGYFHLDRASMEAAESNSTAPTCAHPGPRAIASASTR